MNSRAKSGSGILIITVFFLTILTPLFSQALLKGHGSQPLSPATLNPGDSFILSPAGSVSIKFTEGPTVSLVYPSEGEIVSEGIKFAKSAAFVNLGNASSKFIVQTSQANIESYGGAFFIQNDENAVKLVVTGKTATVGTKSGETHRVNSGQTFILLSGKASVRNTRIPDLKFWRDKTANALATIELGDSIPKKFGEVFIYSMSYVEKGGGTVYFPDNRAPQSPAEKELAVFAGCVIRTCASETASLRLGERTRILIEPDSEIILRNAQIELKTGQCLIRHGNALLPVRVHGKIPISIQSRSSVEIEKRNDSLFITIQEGSITIPASDSVFEAGDRIEISENGINPVDVGVIPRPLSTPGDLNSNFLEEGGSIFRELLSQDLDDLLVDFNSPDSRNGQTGVNNQSENGQGLQDLLNRFEIKPEGQQ